MLTVRALNGWGRTAVRRGLHLAFSRAAARTGFDLVRRDYFSPIPDLDRLPTGFFVDPHPMPGVAWNIDAQAAFLEDALGEHLAAFPYPRQASSGFRLENGNYESVDAETLWAMVRHLKPGRILELGSGFTTLLLAAAAEANAREGHPCELLVYDPYPRRLFGQELPGLTELIPQSALDIPLARFLELGASDVLFVDTTHTVKAGSDVNRIVLDILPQLRPGVVVHFHDVFLPYEYPERWLRQQRWFWAEQYLLHAFLAMNDSFEVVLAANALAKDRPDRVAARIPSFGPDVQPGAFWIRRR